MEELQHKGFYMGDGDVIRLSKYGASRVVLDPLIIQGVNVTEQMVIDAVNMTKSGFKKKYENLSTDLKLLYLELRDAIVDIKIPIPQQSNLSTKDQVLELIADEIVDPKEIALKLGKSIPYIRNILKEIRDEFDL